MRAGAGGRPWKQLTAAHRKACATRVGGILEGSDKTLCIALEFHADDRPGEGVFVVKGSVPNATVVPAEESDFAKIITVWEASVRATHHFVSEADIAFFKPMVRTFLPEVELSCAKNERGTILGFLGVAEAKVEMLFVSPTHFEKGVGGLLLAHAVNALGAMSVDVNEQNPRAVRFYERFGFKTVGRSPLDGSGKPYPLLHMRLQPEVETCKASTKYV